MNGGEIQLSKTQAHAFTFSNFAPGDVYDAYSFARMVRYALGGLGAGKYNINAWDVIAELVRNGTVAQSDPNPELATYTVSQG